MLLSARRSSLFLLTAVAAGGVIAACSASNEGSQFASGAGAGDAGTTVSAGGNDSSTGVGGDFNPTTVGTGGTTSSGSSCATPADVDDDLDGFTENDGDCNDCDLNVNPGSIEVIAYDDGSGNVPEAADEDCDDIVDNIPDTCDTGLAIDDVDPYSGAKAVDLCQRIQDPSADKRWGVLDAKYVRANGAAGPAALQYGIMDNFGDNVNPQGGDRLLVLTSGQARRPQDPNACQQSSCTPLGFNAAGTPPPGFPQDVPNCSGLTNINDDVALELKLRAPKNATGYTFLFDFYSFEFPEYVCTSYNDQFIALVSPPPVGSISGNISFDSQNNPVSVNIAFFDVCDPSQIGNFALLCFSGGCPSPPNPYCPLGTAELVGNGFDGSWGEDAGGTSWLQTSAPITGGEEFTIRWAIWDTGDTALDSTALIDGFQWIANGGTVAVGTEPVPDPK